MCGNGHLLRFNKEKKGLWEGRWEDLTCWQEQWGGGGESLG